MQNKTKSLYCFRLQRIFNILSLLKILKILRFNEIPVVHYRPSFYHYCFLGLGLVEHSGGVFIHVKRLCFLPLQNLKELVLVAVVALVEVADLAEAVAAVAVVVAVAAAVAALEVVDHQAWEDCSRLECRS